MSDTPSSALATLLAPLPPESFLADTFGRQYLHVQRPPVAGLVELYSPTDLEFLVSTLDLTAVDARHPKLRLVHGPAELPTSAVVQEGGLADLQRVQEAYRRGHTLVLNGVSERLPALWSFARGLERDLGSGVVIHLYLTPPWSQGFEAHSDTRDVFFLQVRGTKRWSVYGPRAGDAGPFADRLAEVDLRAGELLYLPRGFGHAGRAQADPSLHLTFTLRPLVLRARVEPWDRPLDLDVRLRRPSDLAARLIRQADSVVLDRLSGSLRCPIHAEPALRRILSGEPFTARELPGNLDEAGRLALVRRLIAEGFLQPEDET